MINDNYSFDRITNVQELLDAIKNSLPYEHEHEIGSITATLFTIQRGSRFRDVKSDIIIDTLYDYWSKSLTEDEVSFEKKNFYLLDGQRCFKPNSFDKYLYVFKVVMKENDTKIIIMF